MNHNPTTSPSPVPPPLQGGQREAFGLRGASIITGSMCPGSVRYWAMARAAGTVLIDTNECHLPLRHSHHRYAIMGPNGVQNLTVPLVGATHNMATPMSEVRISEHGNWRRLHWGALYSAYGRTPYFDHIAPELEPIIMGRQTHLLEFNTQLQRLIADFMALPIHFITDPAQIHSQLSAPTHQPITDLRGQIDMKRSDQLPVTDVPYYQVWAYRHGFVPRLSVLDLLMNEGREGIFTLMRMMA